MDDWIKCPKCGCSDVSELDEINSAYEEGSRFESDWRGCCANCGTFYRWTEVYLFDRVQNIEEEENEENE